MKKNLSTWQLVLHSLRENIPVILLYVLHSKGSSPGRQGFMMAVNSNNEMCGSLGGGIMEHKFVEMAKASLSSGKTTGGTFRQVHDKSAKQQSGMICSGEQTIFLYEVQSSDLENIEMLMKSIFQNQNGSLKLSNNGIQFNNEIPHVNFSFESTE